MHLSTQNTGTTVCQTFHVASDYLMVYRSVPSSWIRSSLLGMVMLWATDFFPLWKKVSGVQILLAIRLLRGRIFIGPLNFNLSSFQLWRKNTSMVYSCGTEHDFALIHSKRNPFRNSECPAPEVKAAALHLSCRFKTSVTPEQVLLNRLVERDNLLTQNPIFVRGNQTQRQIQGGKH